MDPIPTTSLLPTLAEIDRTLAEKDNGQSLESAGILRPGRLKEGATINATVDDRDSEMEATSSITTRVRVERILNRDKRSTNHTN